MKTTTTMTDSRFLLSGTNAANIPLGTQLVTPPTAVTSPTEVNEVSDGNR